MREKDSNIDILNEDTMMERGNFTANGYTFIVRPIYLKEEEEFFSDVMFSPIPEAEEGIDKLTDEKLSQWAIALFSKEVNNKSEKKKKKFEKIFSFFYKKKDYNYYSDVPVVQPLIKWIERKVTYRGRKIRFYDLERKYWISKADIIRLIIYLYKISGFPMR